MSFYRKLSKSRMIADTHIKMLNAANIAEATQLLFRGQAIASTPVWVFNTKGGVDKRRHRKYLRQQQGKAFAIIKAPHSQTPLD